MATAIRTIMIIRMITTSTIMTMTKIRPILTMSLQATQTFVAK